MALYINTELVGGGSGDLTQILTNTNTIITDTTAILVDTANIIIDTTAILVDTTAILVDTANIITDTTAILVDTANILTDTATIIDTTDIIESHIHNVERWGGLAAVPNAEIHRCDFDVMTPFAIWCGNDDYGAWIQVLGSGDTPVISGNTYFDLARLLIAHVDFGVVRICRYQIAWGEDANAAVAADNYTEFTTNYDENLHRDPSIIVNVRLAVGTKVWVRYWMDSEDNEDTDFLIGIREDSF